MRIFVSDSCIKGYHIYKIKPELNVQLSVVKEEGNKFDENAMIVCNTDDKIVGRVPANLCKLFRQLCSKATKISWCVNI